MNTKFKISLVTAQLGLTYIICYIIFYLRGIPRQDINQRLTNGYPHLFAGILPILALICFFVGGGFFIYYRKNLKEQQK